MNIKEEAEFYEKFFSNSSFDIKRPWLYYGTGDYPNIERYVVVTELVDALALPPNARVLDVGCGGGVLSACLASRFKAVTSTDIGLTPDMRATLFQNPNIYFCTSALPWLPFANNSFDIVVCSEVIEHLNDQAQREAMEDLGRVLALGGRLVLSTPNPLGYVIRMQQFLVKMRGQKSSRVHGAQYRENWLTPKALSALIPPHLTQERRMGSYFVPPVEKRLPRTVARWFCELSHGLRRVDFLYCKGMYQYRVLTNKVISK